MIKGFPSISIIYATNDSPAKPNDPGRRAIQECAYKIPPNYDSLNGKLMKSAGRARWVRK